MSKILLTGATGGLGGATLDLLLRKLPSRDVAAMARDPAKLAGRAAAGVDVRKGDYSDYDSLVRAFDGVETLFLVSSVAFSDRATQEANALRAAKAADVRHVVYTSIQKRPGSTFKISQATDTNDRTEKALADSGMHFTILRNSLYLDVVPMLMGQRALTSGIRVPPSSGRAALAKRIDLAEGAAAVLTQSGHENKTYTLGGSEAFSIADVASVLSEATGRQIPYVTISPEQYVSEAVAEGMPKPFAEFAIEWLTAIAVGEFAEVTGDLERLIGRKPTNYREFFRELAANPSAQ
ncbi:NAD(P)H-binding protein [Sorangium sp. So ce119]|uniref:NmrA family NAD(P)-binding protein n=1 Tax=Sorangium sp. So ce119 TaxID=3133279 RepID=UPI003F605F45